MLSNLRTYLLTHSQALRINNKLVFNDMIKNTLALLSIPSILRILKDAYPYILSDEFQDSNPLQCEIICKLADNRTTVVGDVNQLIYQFQGASSGEIIKLTLAYLLTHLLTYLLTYSLTYQKILSSYHNA